MKTIDELDALYAEMEDAARRATEGAGTLLHAQSAFHASTVAKEVFRSALVNAWPEVRERLRRAEAERDEEKRRTAFVIAQRDATVLERETLRGRLVKMEARAMEVCDTGAALLGGPDCDESRQWFANACDACEHQDCAHVRAFSSLRAALTEEPPR